MAGLIDEKAPAAWTLHRIAHHLTTVSLALATMAASSSSVISMARLKTWVSEVLHTHRSPVFCDAGLPPEGSSPLRCE